MGRPAKSARHGGAARSRAQLGYAGGSWRSPDSADIGDHKVPRAYIWKPIARNFRNRDRVRAGEDANYKRHVPTRLFHMIGKRVIIIINGMLMCDSVGMPMGYEGAVVPIVRMAERKAKIVMAGIAGSRFRRHHKHTLQSIRDCRRQHHRDG
jgi:hypothetical protein